MPMRNGINADLSLWEYCHSAILGLDLRHDEKETSDDNATSTRPYALTRDEAITDLWWPFGPVVGRYSIKAGADQTAGRLIQLVVRGITVPRHRHHHYTRASSR